MAKLKVKVSSRPEKFRRAGMEFTREARVIEVDEKTLKILKSEPLLVVEPVKSKNNVDDNKGKDK